MRAPLGPTGPNTPAALAVRVAGSVRVALGPDGGGASVTRSGPGSAGPGLSPPGPPGGGGPGDGGGGQAGPRRSGRRVPLCAVAGGGLGAGDDQEGVGQQGQGDVPVPARPAAALCVVRTNAGFC